MFVKISFMKLCEKNATTRNFFRYENVLFIAKVITISNLGNNCDQIWKQLKVKNDNDNFEQKNDN